MLALPTIASAVVPSNDKQTDAFDGVLGFTLTQDTTDADIDAEEPFTLNDPDSTTCPPAPDPSGHTMGNTTWFRIKGTGRPITLSTAGSDFDTMMVVYDTDGIPAPRGGNSGPDLNWLWCDDDSPSGVTSDIELDSVLGRRYLVQVGGCCGETSVASGNLSLTILSPPANDDRQDAANITAGTPAVGDNLGATIEPGESTHCDADTQDLSKSVWFKYTATSIGDVTFTSSGPDTVMQVYRGNDSQPLTCDDDFDPNTVGPSRVAMRVTPGDYYVQVGGCCSNDPADAFDASDGVVTLSMEFQEDLDLDDDNSRRPTDCDDNDPNVHPGASDPPHDGRDQDCNGLQNNDSDGDHFDDPPVNGERADCDDGNPNISPVEPEIPGNFVDENCDDATPAALLSPFPLVISSTPVYRKYTLFRRLVVKKLRADYRVSVICRGDRHCPRPVRNRRAGRSSISFPQYKKLKLKPGAVVDVRVILPDSNLIGANTTYRVKNRVRPQRLDRCLLPPGFGPAECR